MNDGPTAAATSRSRSSITISFLSTSQEGVLSLCALSRTTPLSSSSSSSSASVQGTGWWRREGRGRPGFSLCPSTATRKIDAAARVHGKVYAIRSGKGTGRDAKEERKRHKPTINRLTKVARRCFTFQASRLAAVRLFYWWRVFGVVVVPPTTMYTRCTVSPCLSFPFQTPP